MTQCRDAENYPYIIFTVLLTWSYAAYILLRQIFGVVGFHDGFVLLNDNDKKSTLGEASGTVPDGDFSTDTGLSFCCRGDGSVFEEITLPKDQSFVMFMNQGETECQKVKGAAIFLRE